MSSHLRLRHVDSGYWLHCPSLGGESDRNVELPLTVREEPQVADVYRFEAVGAAPSKTFCTLRTASASSMPSTRFLAAARSQRRPMQRPLKARRRISSTLDSFACSPR